MGGARLASQRSGEAGYVRFDVGVARSSLTGKRGHETGNVSLGVRVDCGGLGGEIGCKIRNVRLGVRMRRWGLSRQSLRQPGNITLDVSVRTGGSAAASSTPADAVNTHLSGLVCAKVRRRSVEWESNVSPGIDEVRTWREPQEGQHRKGAVRLPRVECS
jgi:hypothetical protein